jgi:hypothetical protein
MKASQAAIGLVVLVLAIIAFRFSGVYKITGTTALPEGMLSIAIAVVIVVIVAIFIAVQQRSTRSAK